MFFALSLCSSETAPIHRRYIMVIVQYVRKLHSEKLSKCLSQVLQQSKNKQNWRLTEEQNSDALTGYSHNSVTPIGSLTPLTLIISHHTLSVTPEVSVDDDRSRDAPRYIRLGGGAVDVKWKVKIDELIAAFGGVIADITYD